MAAGRGAHRAPVSLQWPAWLPGMLWEGALGPHRGLTAGQPPCHGLCGLLGDTAPLQPSVKSRPIRLEIPNPGFVQNHKPLLKITDS